MSYRYLVKSHRHLAQYVACNLMPKGYYFYTSFLIPQHKDPVLTDAKLTLMYDTMLTKSQTARRKKANRCSVKYVRCGRLCFLFATHGKGLFFEREKNIRDARSAPVGFGPYSIGVNRGTGKTTCHLHRNVLNRLKRFILEWATRREVSWWERWFHRWPFPAFKGVRDQLFTLLRFLNACRKDFRLPVVDWKACDIRKTITPQAVFLPTPEEVISLLVYERKRR